MKVKLSDIIEAIDFMSGDPFQSCEGFIHIESGKIYLRSEYLDAIDLEELPGNLDDADLYLPLPTKNDLGLGSQLPVCFAEEYAPDLYNEVRAMFRHQGALGRFKDWADRHQLLAAWYRFEKECSEKEIKAWCGRHNIQFID
ncbi:hypothetical protein HA050_01220 [Iodobacter sp. HSC-16F04]|uniref:Uncharacterized protein n=1 Tax=Iodobacter violaceini TaxID=3044271 RepID=A0ABX0KX11_9NEIS|nr:hypothetical protein [Iodobacter violacea]NHQ84738.1 hypothetical protein [Iodobacter violacea]